MKVRWLACNVYAEWLAVWPSGRKALRGRAAALPAGTAIGSATPCQRCGADGPGASEARSLASAHSALTMTVPMMPPRKPKWMRWRMYWDTVHRIEAGEARLGCCVPRRRTAKLINRADRSEQGRRRRQIERDSKLWHRLRPRAAMPRRASTRSADAVLSRYTVLPWEDETEDRALVDALVTEHAPEGPTEEAPWWRSSPASSGVSARLRMAEAATYREKLRLDAGRRPPRPRRTSGAALLPITGSTGGKATGGKAISATAGRDSPRSCAI